MRLHLVTLYMKANSSCPNISIIHTTIWDIEPFFSLAAIDACFISVVVRALTLAGLQRESQLLAPICFAGIPTAEQTERECNSVKVMVGLGARTLRCNGENQKRCEDKLQNITFLP